MATEIGDRETLERALGEAQRERAAKFEALEKAREGATAFDVDTIRRRFENLDRAASRAGEERLELLTCRSKAFRHVDANRITLK